MSGIFGFTYQTEDLDAVHSAQGSLEFWNRIYGRSASATQCIGNTVIGCHVEHFANGCPHSSPVLSFGEQFAVIDALLYNRSELLEHLALSDSSNLSDEELLLCLLRQKGYEALALVNGDFAGAVFDPGTKQWTLFRDHMGVRPLYFYLDDALFAFSTDLRGLAGIPGVDLKINEKMLYTNMISFNSLNMTQTDFQHIHCIRPASFTKFSSGECGYHAQEYSYWKLRRRKIRLRDDAAYEQRLRELITDAVQRRLNAVPGLVGAELSGGLDSGVIDILINRAGRDARYFSWSWDTDSLPINADADERSVILDICKQEKIDCHFIRSEDYRIGDTLYDQIWPPFVNTFFLTYGSRWLHSKGARVVFTGHGGDEGVSHRTNRFELFYNGEFFAYFKLYYQDLQGKPLRMIRALRSGLIDAWYKWREHTKSAEESDYECPILKASFVERMRSDFQDQPFYFTYAPHKYIEQGGSRNRLDNAALQGAGAGVRYMFPYLDYRVVDFAVSIPRRLYVGTNANRLIFRNAFRDMIPKSLYDVNYKDLASVRPIRTARKPQKEDAFQEKITAYLSALDHEYWDGILDFDALRNLKRPEHSESDEERTLNWMYFMLDKCLLIQRTAQRCGEWRKADG